MLFHVLPIYVHQTTWVTCQRCQREHYAKVDAEELCRRDADEIEVGELISTRSSRGRFLAVSSIVLAAFPVMGLLISTLVWLENRRSRGWPRTCSVIGLWISICVTSGFVLWAVAAGLFHWN